MLYCVEGFYTVLRDTFTMLRSTCANAERCFTVVGVYMRGIFTMLRGTFPILSATLLY